MLVGPRTFVFFSHIAIYLHVNTLRFGYNTANDRRRQAMGKMEYARYLQSDRWKELARACKRRAGYRCQLCNSADNLQAHHRTYDRKGKPGELNDLTCLCEKCHKKFHMMEQSAVIDIRGEPLYSVSEGKKRIESHLKNIKEKLAPKIQPARQLNRNELYESWDDIHTARKVKCHKQANSKQTVR